MEYRDLGWSGIQVSPICIGGMSFGKVIPGGHQWVCGPDETEAVIERTWELGLNYIDTANCYATGTSEEYIGRAIKHLGIPRDKIVLQSKVFFNEGALSAAAIRREIDGTLGRLGTDYLDVYVIHRFDYDTPIEETLEALHGLVKEGKVRALGASAMYAYQFHDMQIIAQANGWTPFTVMQNHYNLLYREDERELIPVCHQYNVALAPYSPLASGHLARSTWDSDSVRSRTDATMRQKYDAARDDDMAIVERVTEVARRLDRPMADVALAWLWARGVTAPTVGCSRPSRVTDAVMALNTMLSDDDIAYIEEPYRAHELVGPLARPGEKPLAGTLVPAGVK